MAEAQDRIAATAERHKLSPGAVRALADALAHGHGGAQWNHPDLGGMGQWSGGGMLQIGDMFNHDLKARVGAALEDLSKSQGSEKEHPRSAGAKDDGASAGGWWPSHLGTPSSTGAQNAMRYACFPDKKRLVVEREGKTTVYDTGEHRLTGFSQAQSGTQRLEFSGPDGRVTLDDLQVAS